MFNKLNKLTAYILIMSLLTGICSVPATATGINEEQGAPAETVQEETHDSSNSDGGSDNSGVESGDSEGQDYSEIDHSVDSDEYRDGNDSENAEQYHDESVNDDEATLNEEEGSHTDDNDAGTNTSSSGWYDTDGNWHSDDAADNSGAGYTNDYTDDSEQNQDPNNQDGQDTTAQGTTDQAQQGQTNTEANPQDHPTAPQDPTNPQDAANTQDPVNPQDAANTQDPTTPQAPADPTETPIEKRPQTVTGQPSYDKHLGDDFFRLDVSTDGDGPLIFWSSNESVIDMSHTGRAYIKGTGTAVIGIQAEETEHCKKSNVMRVTITVRKREQKVDVPVYYTKSVETEPFKIDLTKSGNGPVIYESSNKNVATVSKTGKVTIKSVGSAKITVYAAETATCMKSAAKTIRVNVGPPKTELAGSINVEDNKATVEWQQQNDVSGYLVQYSTRRDFSDSTVVRAGSTARSAEISGLKDDAYYVRVRSYKKQGEKNLYSEWSAAEAFGGKIATPAAGVIPGTNSNGSRAGTSSGTATIVRNTGSAGISGKIGTGEVTGTVGTGDVIGPAGTGEGQGSAPMFSTIVTNPYWAVGKALSMRVTNRGSTVMRVYSEGAWLSNGIGGLFDRDLYIAAPGNLKLPYVDIQPGEVVELRFRSADNKMLRYSRKTKLCYEFSYDGVKYTAVSNEDNSTEYTECDISTATDRPGLPVSLRDR